MSGKRKREAKTTELRVVSYVDEPAVTVGSFFNGLSVPSSTKFDLYKNKKNGEYLLHGENETLDYNGQTGDDDYDYAVALYDPVNKSVELFKSPLVESKVTARENRVHKGPRVKQAGIRFSDQRKLLGESFGTKKAKSALSNLERNRIDAEKLQDLELDIIDNVKENTIALPSTAEMNRAVTHDRPTPVANEDATNVEDIYPLENIIPNKEFSFIRVGPLLEEEDEAQRLEILPYSKSSYISKHIGTLVANKNTTKLQLLYYASLLFGVYENRRVKDKASLMTRLQNKPSEALVDGILEKFTIARASQFGKSKDRSFIIDPHHEDKLLCYLLAIIMHIDNFMIELPPLANELNMKPTRLVGLCKALGANVKSATVSQAEAFGIPRTAASTYKIATLKVPFKLPQMTKRGRAN